ncbi:hypothetical protein M758_7G174500 [Ceratodon purpureus]|uniref:Iron-sulfur cluster biosynthesis family protein n=1 Tax=Ceratodon purpureus TaxID=3225 RepID=A0A8T0HCW6_CERPU|nr:hypothetical protein KC19_7G177600 [Ceratodon purpureus]KAG0611900.1 hypothetical protein M758_7G174500 [Ceratodon purpureus]
MPIVIAIHCHCHCHCHWKRCCNAHLTYSCITLPILLSLSACVRACLLACLLHQVIKMHSAVISDWRTASAPNAITASTSYSTKYSGPPPILTHQERHTSKSRGPSFRLRGACGNRQRIIPKRKDAFRISGLSSRHSSGSTGSEILGKQLGQVQPHGWRRSWKRVQGPVGLQQFENENGGRDFAPALKPKSIEIDSLPPFVRDSTMKAVDDLGRRVTVGDVASRAGLKLTQAETALQALAADSGGFLEVSDEGDVLYVLPKDYRANLTSKSLRMKYEPLLEKLKALAEYVIRVSFGTALLASIAIVYTSIVVILSSGRSDDDNRGNRGGYQSQRYNNPGFGMYISPADLLWYWNPNYYRSRRPTRRGGGMNFFESVFSFVFGDSDPNEGLEEVRWRSIGDTISSKGGVVSAEELAPYLDVPSYSEETKGDESYVLPVLLRFDGHPEVDEQGNILYRFPSLQRTAVDWLGRRKESPNGDGLYYFAEKQWNFSKASKGEQALVIGLGALNLAGVVILSSLLRDYSVLQSLRGSGLIPFAAKALPFLQAYTASFFAIPAFRWFLLQRRNAEIEKRNRARLGWVAALERAGTELRQKLRSARDSAKRTVLGRDRIIYSTEKDVSAQDYEAQDWEQRLKERK